MTIAELAAYVGSHLRKREIEVVLSGGACVSIYSKNNYVSMDLDLINIHLARRGKIYQAMVELGFYEDTRYFKHTETEFFVEFPNGPLSVGEEPVKQVDEHKIATGLLRLLSPTDCVKDRLAGYFHWEDLQCLEQAELVAKSNRINLKEIERWSKAEGKPEEFNRIKSRLSGIVSE